MWRLFALAAAFAPRAARADDTAPDLFADDPAESLEPAEIDHMAGTGGDALSAAAVLPGFAPPVGTDAEPTFRGQGGEDLDWRVLGVELPAPFHTAGRRGVVDPGWVDRLSLRPGAPLDAGDAVDVVDVSLRAPRTDGVHAGAALDPFGAGARVEAPLRGGRRPASVGLSVRRTLLDLWGPARVGEPAPAAMVTGPIYGAPVPASADATFSEAPVGWDYLFQGAARLGSADGVRLVLLGSNDRVGIALADPADVDPAMSGEARSVTDFHLALLRWQRPGNALTLALSRQSDRVVVGSSLRAERTRAEARLRDAFRRSIDRFLALEVGAEVVVRQETQGALGPPPPEEGAPRVSAALGPHLVSDFVVGSVEPAGWIATPFAPTRAWRIVPGVRIDAYAAASEALVDPRVTSVAALDAETTIRGHVGSWSRRPDFWRTTPSYGTPGLGAERTAEAAIGADRAIAPFVLSLDGFARSISGRPVALPDESARGYRLDASGRGRMLGAGVAVRVPPSPDGWALVSYEISTSERDDGGGPARPWSGDRLHTVLAAASLSVGDGWQLGARFRLASGAPVPRVVGATYDADRDAWRPITDGTSHLPYFHQLDLRVDRSWAALGGTITIWVDVQNLYDRSNAIARTCSFDFGECTDVRGLPLVPTAGLEGDF